ncbi:hypothetical protein DFH06DRAFT_1203257 [Mycena polygramma]|nr:hypothetical protein DFH06DRAFT_1203257 [Mycena polygramma]
MGNASAMPHSPQPTRPISFTGGDNPAQSANTPRSIYGPPVGAAPFGTGTGYPTQTPGVAAGYPLPTSRSNSTATTTPHQRAANMNAGATPAGFNQRPLTSRPGSRASSRTSGGFPRYTNQTPNPNANLGITNPYTTITEDHESDSDGSSDTSLGLPRMNSIDRMTMNNTYVNATAGSAGRGGAGASMHGGPVIPVVIPPSPAHSYRPMR